ncbi:MAG: exodeoxyribonuclease VII small subunit [Candidatus Ancaeobacter aquaticus]|nr:exodeoxyribonuclease VII small subunit [Candidatus Ancaeobacter aquaticus]
MKEIKFEDALQNLETIVGDMEAGELSLDESLKKYEEGIKLSRFCLKKLDEAEKKIEMLQKGLDGKVKKKKFVPEKNVSKNEAFIDNDNENLSEEDLF